MGTFQGTLVRRPRLLRWIRSYWLEPSLLLLNSTGSDERNSSLPDRRPGVKNLTAQIMRVVSIVGKSYLSSLARRQNQPYAVRQMKDIYVCPSGLISNDSHWLHNQTTPTTNDIQLKHAHKQVAITRSK